MRKFFALLLAVLMLGSFATVAFANDSPVGEKEHQVTVTYEFETPETGGVVIVKDGNEYTLTPKEKSGYEFDHYVIDQTSYEVVSKDGSKWVIRVKGDLTIHVYYKGVKSTPNPVDNKPVSPKTSDNAPMIAVIVLFGLCGAVVASKKLARN